MTSSTTGHSALNPQTTLAIERNYLAIERNLLAWMRTAITLITFGFSIHHFFREGLPGQQNRLGPTEFGFYMIVIGLVALLLAILQYRRDRRYLASRYASHIMPASYTIYIAVVFGGLSVAGLVGAMWPL